MFFNYRNLKFFSLMFLFLFFTGMRFAKSGEINGWSFVAKIEKNINVPEFQNKTCLITDFGAKEGGTINCRNQIQKAIDVCASQGGGIVMVPEGTFLTGALELKSRVNLHISKNATLLFSRDYDEYLPMVHTRFEGVECMNYSPLIYAKNQKNLGVTGEGTLDGQADTTYWWPWSGREIYGYNSGTPNQRNDRDALLQMAEDNVPIDKRRFGKGHYLRPSFIEFYKCEAILIDKIHIKRSPMWEIHPVLCKNVTVKNVKINSHGPNNDGCNPECSQYVLVDSCYFNTGDDCIAIKSGRNADGRRVNVPSEKIIIRNCTMKDGHGGVVIGSEISGGCRDVFAENCIMDSPNLERALRIKTNSLRGGIVENIYMRNVTVGQVSDAVLRINFNYENGDAGQYTPVVRNVYMENVTSQKSNYAIYLDGYQRSPITGVHLKSCRFMGVQNENLLNHVKDLKLDKVEINGNEYKNKQQNF